MTQGWLIRAAELRSERAYAPDALVTFTGVAARLAAGTRPVPLAGLQLGTEDSQAVYAILDASDAGARAVGRVRSGGGGGFGRRRRRIGRRYVTAGPSALVCSLTSALSVYSDPARIPVRPPQVYHSVGGRARVRAGAIPREWTMPWSPSTARRYAGLCVRDPAGAKRRSAHAERKLGRRPADARARSRDEPSGAAGSANSRPSVARKPRHSTPASTTPRTQASGRAAGSPAKARSFRSRQIHGGTNAPRHSPRRPRRASASLAT